MADLQKLFGIEQNPKVKQEQGEKKEKQVEDPKKKQFDQGFGNAKKMGYIKLDKGLISKVANDLPDKIKLELQSFNNIKLGSQQAKLLIERKLALIQTIKYFDIKKGIKYAPKFREQFAALTTEQLLSGEWKDCDYKSINLNAEGEKISMGNLHPLLKVRKQFSQILIGLGFEEMPTNQFVESSFWNFDALFQPQKHPARDAHDINQSILLSIHSFAVIQNSVKKQIFQDQKSLVFIIRQNQKKKYSKLIFNTPLEQVIQFQYFVNTAKIIMYKQTPAKMK